MHSWSTVCILKSWLECPSWGFLSLSSRISIGVLMESRQSHFAHELPLALRLLRAWEHILFVYRRDVGFSLVLQGVGCWGLPHLSGNPLEVVSGSPGRFAWMCSLFVLIPSGKHWEIWGWMKLDNLKPSHSAWGENIGRSRVWMHLCEHRQGKKPSTPRKLGQMSKPVHV